MSLYDELSVLSDEEDDFINEEDKQNKLREITRIEDEVLRKQKEIEALLKKKNEEKEYLIKNQQELEEQQKQDKQRKLDKQQEKHKIIQLEEVKRNKRNILYSNQAPLSFAEKLETSRKIEKAHKVQRKEFLQARKYAFGLENDESILVNPIAVDEIERFSGQELSKRYVDSETLEKAFSGKKILRVDKLFAKVHPPDFKEPPYPNWVLVGIIINKDDPKTTNSKQSNKYVKLTISNFTLNVHLMLFGAAFEKYWKLQVGDVIGVLNPSVSPWKNPSTGQFKSFNLTLSTAEDSIIELGRSKNYGRCKAYRKNYAEKQCGIPVDKSKSEYCEYHQNLSLKRITANRMELGGLSTSGGLNKLRNTVDSKQVLMNQNYKTNDPKSFGIQIYDNPYASKFSHENELNTGKIYFSNLNAKRAFFDDDYVNPDSIANVDAKRKKLNNKRKEQELIQKLLSIKGGEVLKASSFFNNSNTPSKEDNKIEREKNSKVFQAAFNPDTINQLGFDPTRKLFNSSLSSKHHQRLMDEMLDQRGRAKEKISKLEQIRKRKKIHLSPSREARLQRAKTWNANHKSLANYKKTLLQKEDSENYLSSSPSTTPSPRKSKVSKAVEIGQSSKNLSAKLAAADDNDHHESSDSDLDIDFGDSEKKNTYYSALSKAKNMDK